MNIQRLWFLKIKLILLVGTFWLPCVCAYDEPPRNIIFYIGDGMGFEQVQAAEIYTGSVMSFNNPALFPYRADCTTYSASSSVTDSAAGGTALATGIKVNNGVISMAAPGNGAQLQTLLEYFKAQGKTVGLIAVQTKGLGGSSATLQIADMADFNADGKTDILWRNVNTGAYLWNMMDGLNTLQTKGLGGSHSTLQIVTP